MESNELMVVTKEYKENVMSNTARLSRIISCWLLCFVVSFYCAGASAEGVKTIQRDVPEKTDAQLKLEEKDKEKRKTKSP